MTRRLITGSLIHSLAAAGQIEREIAEMKRALEPSYYAHHLMAEALELNRRIPEPARYSEGRRPIYALLVEATGPAREELRYCSLRTFVLSKAMTTITCKIPDEVSAHLEAAARQRRVPKSQIVREALAASFRKNKPKVSAFDLMKDACGMVKGGPKDYASHPRHLRDFGAS